jgi:hypothetical protein
VQSIKKSIDLFSGEKYRNLDYGTIYYVAGTASSEINDYVLTRIDQLSEMINQNEHNWVTCKIVYLKAENPFFPADKKATLYSAMMPEDDMFLVTGDSNFLVGTLIDCEPKNINEAFSKFFSTLQQMFDEVLDKGVYNPNNLGITYLGWEDDGIRFSMDSTETEAENDDSLTDGIRFSISGRGKPGTSQGSDNICNVTNFWLYTKLIVPLQRISKVRCFYCITHKIEQLWKQLLKLRFTTSSFLTNQVQWNLSAKKL